MSVKANLKSLIAAGKTRQAVERLLDLTKSDADLHAEAVALSARFQKYLREKHGNTASLQDLDIELNRIHAAALDLTDRLPDTAASSWFKDWRKVAAAIVSVIVFGAAAAELSGYSLRDIFTKNTNPPTVVDSTGTAKLLADTLPATSQRSVPVSPSQGTTKPTSRKDTPEPPPFDTTLTIACKTDKGTQNLRYREGETMRLFFKASQPCHLRTLYKLADNSLVLFDDDRQLTPTETGRFVEIGSGYEASAPFGSEALYVFAQSAPFPALRTEPHPDGYLLVAEGLPDALRKTRGFKKKHRFAEASLDIVTVAK